MELSRENLEANRKPEESVEFNEEQVSNATNILEAEEGAVNRLEKLAEL